MMQETSTKTIADKEALILSAGECYPDTSSFIRDEVVKDINFKLVDKMWGK